MSTPSTEVNLHLNECLEGTPDELASVVIEALALISGKEALNPYPERGPLNIQTKVATVRQAYTSLLIFLIEQRLEHMNDAQKLFVNTGAIADLVVFEDLHGQHHEIELLAPEIYAYLRANMLDIDEEALPPWAHNIYRVQDQFNAIALGVLEPEGLNKKNLAKFRATRGLEHQRDMSREQMTILNNTYYSLIHQSREVFDELQQLFESYQRYVKQMPVLNETLSKAQHYNRLIAARDPQPEEREELSKLLNDPTYRRLGQYIDDYAEEVIQIMHKIQTHSQDIDLKNQRLKEVTTKLIQAGTQDVGSVRNRQDIIFDEETLRLIKNHVQAVGSYAVSAVQQSPFKIPESTTRILLNQHSRDHEDPVNQCYCTIENIVKALQKISALHINLFQLDEAEQPIIPAILIEPIRNYAEWTEERFILGFVSGEAPRHGSKVSFSPVENAVLRICGQYAFRDKIFDYRGNRLEDSLMGEYSARLESKTAVKWIGEEKKYKLVTVMQEVDASSRLEAVEDYMEFVFHAANDFPAPLNISTRKLSVLLKYMTIESLNKTVALILRYVASKEPEEARKVLLYRAGHDRSRASDMLQQACLDYSYLLPESAAYYGKLLT